MEIRLSNSKLEAKIKLKGAELCSLKNKSNGQELIWEGNPSYWGKHSPVLFPIVGTLKNNTYIYNEQRFELLRHGFARDVNFEVINQNENEVVFSLKATSETIKIYPFLFELQLCYTLIESELKITYAVINHDTKAIPFSIGAHPAFALPNPFDSYALSFEKQENLCCFTLENDLLSNTTFTIPLQNKLLPLHYSIFEKDALIFKTLQSKSITLLANKKPLLKVSFSDFKNLGIWTKVGAPFVCIEPWLGYSDAVESTGNILEKDGIQIVKENKTFTCSFSIEIL